MLIPRESDLQFALADSADSGRVDTTMSSERPSANIRFQEELLRLFAYQSRRVPIPVFLSAGIIAALAFGHVPSYAVFSWLALVLTVLAVRWVILGRLPLQTHIPERTRLQFAVSLSAINGIVHGLSLGFFPFLPDLGRALQSMILVALCAGSVSTTAGYMPVFLAYLCPTLGPLVVLWALGTNATESGWVERSTSAWIALSGVFIVSLARDAFRLFRESVAARQRQADLNRQLRIALDQAEAASRAKTRFLASASHDLRQPIHTLSLFGAALTMRPLDYASREIAQHMNTALQVLATQLDALLDISKLDAGVVKVNPTLIKLSNTLERICKEFEPTVAAKGLELVCLCPDDSFVQTDALLFERIIRNLLDNAIKYTDSGSVRLRVVRDNNLLVIELTDTGRGIPKSEQERIFEEFYQIDNPERDRTKGLGLGLAIVRRLIELLQIGMEMNSAESVGTTFLLRVHAATKTVNPEHASVAPAMPRTLHVLVIDDEAGVRLGMKTLLEGMGYRTTLADSVESALAAAQADKPDVVLSDLRLRGESNGIDAVRSIRGAFPDMPAILISGDIAPERLREAEEAGIPLLHKPVPVETLKNAIARRGHL